MKKIWNFDKLNKWFIALYAFQMLISLFVVCGQTANWIIGTEKFQLSQFIDVSISAITIVAIQLLLNIKRIGFYIFVGAEMGRIATFSYFLFMNYIDSYSYFYSATIVIFSIFQIMLLLLLMLLKKGDKNVYQLLWGE